MSRFIYTLILYLITPLVLLKMRLRARKAPAYKLRWAERFGFFPALPTSKKVIWIHSVSVGETIASAPFVNQLMTLYPDHQFVVTTMTPTGSDQVRKLYGDRVFHIYCPYDLPGAQRRFFDQIHPELALIVETELWPNTIAECHKRRIPVIIANARLSEKSAKGYGKLGSLTRSMLQKIDVVACQNTTDGQRFINLGLPEKSLKVTGSVKFDLTIDPAIKQQGLELRESWFKGLKKDAQVIVAASTHEGEDQQVLDAFKQIQGELSDTLLLLVPRHPERFNSVHQLIKENGFSVIRHSETAETTPETQVILGDTMGEMMKFFSASDLAFVGGSLIVSGGHNMLEPAALGLPVLSGPSVYNFQDISRLLVEAEGMQLVQDSQELAKASITLLKDQGRCEAMGENAKAFVEANRGALDRLLNIVQETLDTKTAP